MSNSRNHSLLVVKSRLTRPRTRCRYRCGHDSRRPPKFGCFQFSLGYPAPHSATPFDGGINFVVFSEGMSKLRLQRERRSCRSRRR
ncbi:hypothetical protein TorRG33x02_301210 [Trema orientale]|uniref:Uncharacterized protein n=1 Tax=Trema orientale TaxID=63057 RepID=A0A2P5C1G7_TREOI|nr:hypothetical protein TorRG33x02_301210 [Trema orientale]